MDRLASIREWFNQNLDKPDRFSRTKGPFRQKKGISWFRDSAHEHIRRMREMVEILKRHGISVRQLVTDRPGSIIYEDDFQICAEPFWDTPT